MQTPNIHAGSALAEALSRNAANLAHIRNAGHQQVFGGIALALDSLNRNYQLRKEEEQRDKDNAYRENVFNHQKQADERNFNYQKERDIVRDKQWQQEQNLRTMQNAMQNAISNENLKAMRQKNAFLDALYKNANARYEAAPKAQEESPSLFFSANLPAQNALEPTTQAQEHQAQNQSAQNPQNATKLHKDAGGDTKEETTQNDYLKFASAYKNFQPSTQAQTKLEAPTTQAQTAQNPQNQERDSTLGIAASGHSRKDAVESRDNAGSLHDSAQQKNTRQYSAPLNAAQTKPNHPLSYFRSKIESGTPLDEVDYLHLQAMGLNPNGMGSFNANVNGDLKLKKVDITKGIQKANSALAAIDSTLDLMSDTEKNATFLNNVDRILHNSTFGLTGLNDHNYRYRARDMANAKNIAQAEAGGKATNQDKEDAKMIYSTALRSKESQVHTLSGALENTLFALDEGIRNIRDSGGDVPPNLWSAREKAKVVDNYLKEAQNGKKTFSYKKFRELAAEFKKEINQGESQKARK